MPRPIDQRERKALLMATQTSVILKTGAIIAAATVLAAGAILTLRYGGQANSLALVTQLLLLAAAASFGGVLLRLELRMQSQRPNLPIAVFFPAVFLAFLLGLAALYPSAPSYLEASALAEVSPLMPLTVLIVLTAAYGWAYRAVFFALLVNLSAVDWVKEIAGPEFSDQIHIYWDGAVRYGDPVALIMIRAFPESKAGSTDLDSIAEALQRAIDPYLRRSDRCGRYARDTVWVLLARTNVALAEVPVQRLIERLRHDRELQHCLDRCNAELRCGVAAYERRMQSPQDLANAALAAVEEAARKGRELQFRR